MQNAINHNDLQRNMNKMLKATEEDTFDLRRSGKY